MMRLLALAAVLCGAARAQETQDLEPITVTATRVSEDVGIVPLSVTVVGGDELRARNATDLRSALSLVPGLDIAPGGDGGPAGSVPELWGLKEMDACLLVVDGVPWGGAFNPDTLSLDLHDVERIEVIRGAAPVMYGATSFSGVIHVIHRAPKNVERSVSVSGGSYGSSGVSISVSLPSSGTFSHALHAETDRQGFSSARTDYERALLNWRGEWQVGGGVMRMGAGDAMIAQRPGSPQPRAGSSLTSIQPLDANVNPLGAFLNENRFTANAGFDRDLGPGRWSTLLSLSNADQNIFRGFYDPTEAAPNDAHGFRESIHTLDVYFDTHWSLSGAEDWEWVSGMDFLLGRGSGTGGDFDYFVNLNGNNPPSSAMLPPQAGITVADQRDFSGVYTFVEWRPHPRWLFEGGARLNHVVEGRQTSNTDFGSQTTTVGSDYRDLVRASEAGGVTFTAWESGRDMLHFYGDYRNTFKPSAVDFGLDSVSQILAPETAQSFEVGAKSRWFDDHLDFDVSAFRMDFQNLVVSTSAGGNPALQNAGAERFNGVEAGMGGRMNGDWRWLTSYSLHDARFLNYVSGGNQLSGNRVATSARNMASAGFLRAPGRGVTGYVLANYVGSRFMDRQNTALAPAYVTWSAGVGYKTANWEARLDGHNLNNQRPPIVLSELGDSQLYLLPALWINLTVSRKF